MKSRKWVVWHQGQIYIVHTIFGFCVWLICHKCRKALKLPLSLFANLACLFVWLFHVFHLFILLPLKHKHFFLVQPNAFLQPHLWMWNGEFLWSAACVSEPLTRWVFSIPAFRTEPRLAVFAKQTDSEQTDFAGDGETTATEVCIRSRTQRGQPQEEYSAVWETAEALEVGGKIKAVETTSGQTVWKFAL